MRLFGFDITQLLIIIPAVLVALTVHEYAHGRVAYALGDPTAKYAGRLSLNPVHHIDPIGLLCMIFFSVGWAKPVPVNMRNLKHPKRDMALVALAGPVSNLLLSLLFVFAYYALALYAPQTRFLSALTSYMVVMAQLNITLAVFNLLPIPPLDGSRILGFVLPGQLYYKLMRYERYIQVAVLVLLWFGAFRVPIAWAGSTIISWMENLAIWIFM